MKIKVLTLTQPWATLVAIGAKRIETRSWGTAYRGPLAIHAGKGLGDMTPTDFQRLCNSRPFYEALLPVAGRKVTTGDWIDTDLLPRGAVIAVTDLWTCIKIDPSWGRHVPSYPLPPDEPERSFGNYAWGRYAWGLRNVRRLATPIPVRGALGLWDFTLCDVCEERAALPDCCLCQSCLEDAETASTNAGRLTNEPLAYVVAGRLL